jgi:hypothetical protein
MELLSYKIHVAGKATGGWAVDGVEVSRAAGSWSDKSLVVGAVVAVLGAAI